MNAGNGTKNEEEKEVEEDEEAEEKEEEQDDEEEEEGWKEEVEIPRWSRCVVFAFPMEAELELEVAEWQRKQKVRLKPSPDYITRFEAMHWTGSELYQVDFIY